MKRCSTSLIIREMKSKPQWGTISHQSEWLLSKSLQIINAGEVGRKGNPLTLWWECKLEQPLWRTVWRFLKKTGNKTAISSVAQSCSTLCDPMNCSTPGLPVHHQLPEFTQTHVHQVSDAIQPSHPLSSPSPPTANPSQHQSLFQWVNSSHEVTKVLEFQL